MEISNSQLDECLRKLENCLEVCSEMLKFPYSYESLTCLDIIRENQEIPTFSNVHKQIQFNILNVADSRLEFYLFSLHERVTKLIGISKKYGRTFSNDSLDYTSFFREPIYLSSEYGNEYISEVSCWIMGNVCLRYSKGLSAYIFETYFPERPNSHSDTTNNDTEPLRKENKPTVRSGIEFFIILYVAGKLGAVEPFIANGQEGSSTNENKKKVKIAAEWGMKKWGLKHKVETLQYYTKKSLKEKTQREKFPKVISFLSKYYSDKVADIKRILAEFELNEQKDKKDKKDFIPKKSF